MGVSRRWARRRRQAGEAAEGEKNGSRKLRNLDSWELHSSTIFKRGFMDGR